MRYQFCLGLVFSTGMSLAASNSNLIKAKLPLNIRGVEAIKPDQISYFSIFTGPSIGNGKDPVNEFGEIEEGGISTWNQLSFGWKINQNLRFVANPRFVINHNASDERSNNFQLDDPVFGVAGQWFKRGNLSFGGGINSIMPFSRTSDTKEDGLLFNPGGFNSLTYQLGPALSVGSWIWARLLFFEGSSSSEEDRASFFVSPLVNYSFNDNLGGTIFYQLNGNADNETDISFIQDESLSLLLSYRVSDQLRVEPMLTTFQNTGFDIENANFTMWLSGRIY